MPEAEVAQLEQSCRVGTDVRPLSYARIFGGLDIEGERV